MTEKTSEEGLNATHLKAARDEGVVNRSVDTITGRRDFFKFFGAAAASALGAGASGAALYDWMYSDSKEASNSDHLWIRVTEGKIPGNNVVSEAFPFSLTHIDVAPGRNNIRLPLANDGKFSISQAPADLSGVLSRFIGTGKKVLIEDQTPASLERPTITTGGPVASAFWRTVLNWKIIEPNRNMVKFYNPQISSHASEGLFHDIGFREIQYGERELSRTPSQVDWPLKGKYRHTSGSMRSISSGEQVLILTYINDIGNGTPHLNFTGTNARGVWGALHLFDPKASRYDQEDILKDIERLKASSSRWQLVFRFSDQDEVQTGQRSRKIPRQIEYLGMADLSSINF